MSVNRVILLDRKGNIEKKWDFFSKADWIDNLYYLKDERIIDKNGKELKILDDKFKTTFIISDGKYLNDSLKRYFGTERYSVKIVFLGDDEKLKKSLDDFEELFSGEDIFDENFQPPDSKGYELILKENKKLHDRSKGLKNGKEIDEIVEKIKENDEKLKSLYDQGFNLEVEKHTSLDDEVKSNIKSYGENISIIFSEFITDEIRGEIFKKFSSYYHDQLQFEDREIRDGKIIKEFTYQERIEPIKTLQKFLYLEGDEDRYREYFLEKIETINEYKLNFFTALAMKGLSEKAGKSLLASSVFLLAIGAYNQIKKEKYFYNKAGWKDWNNIFEFDKNNKQEKLLIKPQKLNTENDIEILNTIFNFFKELFFANHDNKNGLENFTLINSGNKFFKIKLTYPFEEKNKTTGKSGYLKKLKNINNKLFNIEIDKKNQIVTFTRLKK